MRHGGEALVAVPQEAVHASARQAYLKSVEKRWALTPAAKRTKTADLAVARSITDNNLVLVVPKRPGEGLSETRDRVTGVTPAGEEIEIIRHHPGKQTARRSNFPLPRDPDFYSGNIGGVPIDDDVAEKRFNDVAPVLKRIGVVEVKPYHLT